MYKKNYYTTTGVSVGVCISKELKFLCDGQGAVRLATLYADRSYCKKSKIQLMTNLKE